MADTFPGSDFARVPPHNLDAERSALGGVLVKPVMFDELATTLGTDDFFLPAHREIFDAMMEISRRQQPSCERGPSAHSCMQLRRPQYH